MQQSPASVYLCDMCRGGGSNSALVRLGRGHKFFSISIAAILRSVILCN